MRRHAGHPVGSLMLVAGALLVACTRTWMLPGDPVDGGPPTDAVSAEIGGASGKDGGPPGSGGRGGMSGTGGQPMPACFTMQEKIETQILTTDLVFIVDRTMSMGNKFGNTTRINAVQSVLRNLIQNNQNAVNFGYAEFPGAGPCASACCPSSNTVFTLPKSGPAIDGAFRQCDFGTPSCLAPNDVRPIAQTLLSVPGLWGTKQPPYPTVVLIADGPPGCPFDDPNLTCQPTLDAISMLRQSETETFIVALGQDAQNDDCLSKMAERAATPTGLIGISDNGPDPMGLLAAQLSPIVAAAAGTSCTIQLKSKPARMDLVAVYVGDREVPPDPTGKNGWSYVKQSSLRIQVRGAECQRLQQARQTDVSVLYGCSPCGETSPCP